MIEYSEVGVGQREAVPGTAWWAYNAVTGYYSSKDYKSDDDRMKALLLGSANDTMSRALSLAVRPSSLVPVMNSN